MITKAQALSATEFHHNTETQDQGRACYRVRRNGRTKTWKTRPDEWVIPVVHGLRGYGKIIELMAPNWHTAEECPAAQAQAEDDQIGAELDRLVREHFADGHTHPADGACPRDEVTS